MVVPDLVDSTEGTPRRVKAVLEVLRWLDMAEPGTLRLTGEDGGDVRLADLWSRRPAALVFLRHYG